MNVNQTTTKTLAENLERGPLCQARGLKYDEILAELDDLVEGTSFDKHALRGFETDKLVTAFADRLSAQDAATKG